MDASTAQNAAFERLSEGFTAELEVVDGSWRSLVCRVLHQARSTFVTMRPWSTTTERPRISAILCQITAQAQYREGVS